MRTPKTVERNGKKNARVLFSRFVFILALNVIPIKITGTLHPLPHTLFLSLCLLSVHNDSFHLTATPVCCSIMFIFTQSPSIFSFLVFVLFLICMCYYYYLRCFCCLFSSIRWYLFEMDIASRNIGITFTCRWFSFNTMSNVVHDSLLAPLSLELFFHYRNESPPFTLLRYSLFNLLQNAFHLASIPLFIPHFISSAYILLRTYFNASLATLIRLFCICICTQTIM